MDRAAIDTDTLVRIALLLVVLWLALEVLDFIFGALGLWFLQPILGIVLLVILILWLLGRI